MKLPALIQQIYYEPSLITPEAHASIRHLFESRLGESIIGEFANDSHARQPGKGVCGERVEAEQPWVADGVAYIPVGGAIGKNLRPFDRGTGAVDVGDIERELTQFEEDPRVRGIILMMDSPGGMVTGTPELAAVIQKVQKPIYAFSDGMIASGAYWIAASTDGIFTTMSASVGSIGVFLPWVDQTKAFEAKGLKVELIKAGKLKGMGFPGTALSDDQRAHLQERVDQIYGMFQAHVTATRPGVEEASMQGQTFLAHDSVKRGLVDAVVVNVKEVAALIPKGRLTI
jgi:signal peptide peptidase SppA